VDLLISDEHCSRDWIYGSAVEPCPVQCQLKKVDSKQPFPHMAKVILKEDVKGLGRAGEELAPIAFSRIMDDFIWESISDKNLPENIWVPEGKEFLEKHKSGFVMNLEYKTEDEKVHELTVDLISVLILSIEQQEKIHEVIPRFDPNKKKYIKDKKLQSNSDGIIVKADNWRLSYSNGEKKIIKLNIDLYRALKYLNKCSEHHIDIPTYYLKEIFCSFVIHHGMNGLPIVRETLALSLADLIIFCDQDIISSPFYCTKLGSRIHMNCSALFKRFEEEFDDEFDLIRESLSLVTNKRGSHGSDCLGFSTVTWPTPVTSY